MSHIMRLVLEYFQHITNKLEVLILIQGFALHYIAYVLITHQVLTPNTLQNGVNILNQHNCFYTSKVLLCDIFLMIDAEHICGILYLLGEFSRLVLKVPSLVILFDLVGFFLLFRFKVILMLPENAFKRIFS